MYSFLLRVLNKSTLYFFLRLMILKPIIAIISITVIKIASIQSGDSTHNQLQLMYPSTFSTTNIAVSAPTSIKFQGFIVTFTFIFSFISITPSLSLQRQFLNSMEYLPQIFQKFYAEFLFCISNSMHLHHHSTGP